jgi:hypothetical protein
MLELSRDRSDWWLRLLNGEDGAGDYRVLE